jgi:cell division protein FtsB
MDPFSLIFSVASLLVLSDALGVVLVIATFKLALDLLKEKKELEKLKKEEQEKNK